MKSRGGQKKHWADITKVKIWYMKVKLRTGLTDYALNKRFAWRSLNAPSSSNVRVWTFERIGKEGREPQGRDPRWRSMGEILSAVDAEPELKGLRDIYDSNFWNFIKIEEISFKEIKYKLSSLFERYSLERVDSRYDSNLRDAIAKHSEIEIYKVSLENTCTAMDDLSALELCWLLYLESRAVESSATCLIEGMLDRKVDDFFNEHIGSLIDHDFYMLTINSMRLVKIARTTADLNRIDKYKKNCLMPIIKV